MEAIILAGGFGTRLQGVVSDVPKPMAPIGGRPFLEILLSFLSRNGFTRVVLAVGYMANVIVDHFGHTFKNLELDYTIEDTPLGTGGAVRLAMTKTTADHVYVFNGDTFLDLEILNVEALWKRHKEQIMVAREMDNTARYGRLVVNESKITGFQEKGVSGRGLINAGCYVLRKNALADFPAGQAFSLEVDYFQKKLQDINLYFFSTNAHFIDIGIPEDFARAQTELKAY